MNRRRFLAGAGERHRNRRWENLAIGLLLGLGSISTYFAVMKVAEKASALPG